MHFGITHAIADFQGYINNVIMEPLDVFVSAYLDDILVYSNPEEEHVEHVIWILQCFLKAGLYLKPE